MKRIATFLLLCIFMVSSSLFVYADYAISDNTYIKQNQVYISREEAVSIFIRAIGTDTAHADTHILEQFSDYGKISSVYTREIAAAVSAGLISGYEDGTFRPQENIARVEALVILNRILSNRTLPSSIDLLFFDTPSWAEADILRLTKAGIVQGYGNGYLGARDTLSREQTLLLAERAARLTGPAGDFYEYANAEWLSETEIPDGYSVWSDFHAINQKMMKKNGEIIYSINRKRNKEGVVFPQGSSEQKIADLFAAGGNSVYRDSLGLEPAKEYLRKIDSVKDIKGFLAVMASLERCGFHGLLPLSIERNAYDSAEHLLAFSDCYTGIDETLVRDGDMDFLSDAYQTYLTDLFQLFEYEDPQGRASRVTDLCLSLAGQSTPLKRQIHLEKNYRILDADAIKSAFSEFDFFLYAKELGFPEITSIACYDLPLAHGVNQVLTPDNLPLLKDYLRASVMDGAALYLNTDAFDVWQAYQNRLNGTAVQASLTDYAVQFVEELLPWDLAALYVETYASGDDKKAVETMTQEILRAYQNRVRINTWMSQTSKQAALKKLQNLQIRVGYPEDIRDYPDQDFEIKSTKEGGNLLGHRITYCNRRFETGASFLGKKNADKSVWSMVPQTVNAMYEPSTNSITIPAGILCPPFYHPTASREQNLGGIGSVIAHEISHALDDIGSRFDEKGNLNPWWLPGDEVAFSKICKDVEDAYSSIEPMPGTFIDGKLTLSENLADIAGMSCLLDVVGAGNPRLDDFFLGYAAIWRNKSTEKYSQLMLQTDTHSPDKIRVNRVLSNFDIFQNYYDIRPGDPMYLPKEKQIQIWNR